MATNTEQDALVGAISPAFDFEIEAAPRETFAVKLVGEVYELHPPKTATTMMFVNKLRAAKVVSAKAKKSGPATKKGQEKELSETLNNAPAMVDALTSWVDSAFTAKDAAKVKERLFDPNDLLDIDHISRLMEAVSKRDTKGDPTS